MTRVFELFKENKNPFPDFYIVIHLLSIFDSVAQLVEQQTLNLWVQSSSLCGVTKDKGFSD